MLRMRLTSHNSQPSVRFNTTNSKTTTCSIPNSFYCIITAKAHAIKMIALTICVAAALQRSPEQQLILHSPFPLQKGILSVLLHNSWVKHPFS